MTQVSLKRDELELIFGTYEDYVVGYQVEEVATKVASSNGTSGKKKRKIQNGEESPATLKTDQAQESQLTRLELEQSFAARSHSGSVRCLAASSNGNLVFSAGYDEMMNLFDLRRRKLLQTFEGAVNCATFVESSHLICGFENNNVCIFEFKNSSLILAKTLKGHKAAVTSLDCHPSGKVLLTISKDHTMRTWNLIKGRCAYVTQIKNDAQLIKWSQAGDEFLIAASNEIYLYNSEGNLRKTIKLERRVNSIEFMTRSIFAVAIDSGKLEFFNLSSEDCPSVIKLEAHGTRIKSVKCLSNLHVQSSQSNTDEKASKPKSNRTANVRFATAASDGSMKIWSLIEHRDTVRNPEELVSVDTGARITCMIASRRVMSK